MIIVCAIESAKCTPYREQLEFIDSQGLCWRCDPNGPCRMCDNWLPLPNPGPANPGPFDRNCPEPRCTAGTTNLRFPVAEDPTRFWECQSINNARATQTECPCGTYFNWASQVCTFPWEVPELCDFVLARPPIPPPRPCTTPPTDLVFDPSCPRPTCSTARELELLFPVAHDPTRFIQCGGVNGITQPIELECSCGTYFWFESQRCEFPIAVPRLCSATHNPPPVPRPCDENGNDPNPTNPSNCVPCIPLWPCNCGCNNQMQCGCNNGNTCGSFFALE